VNKDIVELVNKVLGVSLDIIDSSYLLTRETLVNNDHMTWQGDKLKVLFTSFEQFRLSALFCGGPVDLEFTACQSS